MNNWRSFVSRSSKSEIRMTLFNINLFLFRIINLGSRPWLSKYITVLQTDLDCRALRWLCQILMIIRHYQAWRRLRGTWMFFSLSYIHIWLSKLIFKWTRFQLITMLWRRIYLSQGLEKQLFQKISIWLKSKLTLRLKNAALTIILEPS